MAQAPVSENAFQTSGNIDVHTPKGIGRISMRRVGIAVGVMVAGVIGLGLETTVNYLNVNSAEAMAARAAQIRAVRQLAEEPFCLDRLVACTIHSADRIVAFDYSGKAYVLDRRSGLITSSGAVSTTYTDPANNQFVVADNGKRMDHIYADGREEVKRLDPGTPSDPVSGWRQ